MRGILGTHPPLRRYSLASTVLGSWTTYPSQPTLPGGALTTLAADATLRVAVTSHVGIVAGGAFTFSEMDTHSSSQVRGITVFLGLNAFASTLELPDPFASVMAGPVAR
jgi:hypothetical protein